MGCGGFKISLHFGIVICFFSGLRGCNAFPTYVKELQGRAAVFRIDIPNGKTVATIKLDFQSQTGGINQLAEIINGKLECINACGQLGRRLEMVNETTLRINSLETEDSGVYKVRVRFNGNVYPTYLFYLKVYAPVPKPEITVLKSSQASEGLNVTLQCQVPEGEEIAISWGWGDPISPLEESSHWHSFSDNGSVVHLGWKPGSSDSTITCQASNPLNQKNVSLDLNSIPGSKGANLPLYITLPLVGGGILVVILIYWKRKALKPKFPKCICCRNSTTDATELREKVPLQSAPSQNGYQERPPSESGGRDDPTPFPLHRPLENN